MDYLAPLFPYFRSPTLSDKAWIELHVQTFPPYSDLNFTNIWAWQEYYKTQISIFNKSLIFLTKDHLKKEALILTTFVTDEIENLVKAFHSHLAVDSRNLTIRLLQHGLDPNTQQQFKIKIDPEKISLIKDRDNCEYILSIDKQILLSNDPIHHIGKSINKFKKNNSKYYFESKRLEEIDPNPYVEVFIRWCELKKVDPSENDELIAFKRFLTLKANNIHIMSLFINDKIAAFNCFEILSGGFAIGHFRKYDHFSIGINEILQLEVSVFLKQKNIRYINVEQDLGIEGLRKLKLKLEPDFFLEKYLIGQLIYRDNT